MATVPWNPFALPPPARREPSRVHLGDFHDNSSPVADPESPEERLARASMRSKLKAMGLTKEQIRGRLRTASVRGKPHQLIRCRARPDEDDFAPPPGPRLLLPTEGTSLL